MIPTILLQYLWSEWDGFNLISFKYKPDTIWFSDAYSRIIITISIFSKYS